jgi:chromosome segregation ATPase
VEPHQPLGDAGPPAGDPDPEALRTSVTAELRALRREVAESAAAQRAMWQQVAAGLEAADPGLLALRVDLADALEAVRDRVVATVSDTGDTTRAALTNTTTGVAKVADRLRESLLDRLEEQHSAVRARLAEVAAQSLASTAATRNTSERLATLTTATEQVRRTVQALQGDWNARVDEAAARSGRVAEDSVTELRDRLEAAVSALTTAATGMTDAHRRLDETAAQLQLQSAELLLARSAEPQSSAWAELDLAQRLAENEEPEPEADLLSIPDPESEPEPQRASEPEPEREDLEPAGQQRTADAWYSDDPEEPSSADPAEPPQSTDQPVEQERPARPMPRWRRY